MLDFKVLTAVFAALALTGAAMNGGSADMPEFDSVELPSFSGDAVGAFTRFMPSEEPDTQVSAVLVTGSGEGEVSVTAESLEVHNLTEINVKDLQLQAPGAVKFQDFDGDVKFGNNTSVNGKATGITGSFNLSGDLQISESGRLQYVEARGASARELEFDEVTGTVSSGSTSTDLGDDGTEFSTGAFTGSIRIFPLNGTVILDGEAASVQAGDVSY